MKMAQKHRGPKFPVTHISQDLYKGESGSVVGGGCGEGVLVAEVA